MKAVGDLDETRVAMISTEKGTLDDSTFGSSTVSEVKKGLLHYMSRVLAS